MPDADPLAELLQRAAREPAERPAFYEALLSAQVLVLGTTESGGDGETTVPAGTRLSIQNWQKQDGSAVIPFFTSVPALTRAIASEQRYLIMPARDLFEITRGATLVLNPKSEFGKEFLPNEIAALLSSGTNRAPETRTVETATQVLLGQPKVYPTALVESLRKLFPKHPGVRAAYLALMHDPSVDPIPHLVVGLAVDGDPSEVLRDAGTVAGDVLNEPLDLTVVTDGEPGLSAYFQKSTAPFYTRDS